MTGITYSRILRQSSHKTFIYKLFHYLMRENEAYKISIPPFIQKLVFHYEHTTQIVSKTQFQHLLFSLLISQILPLVPMVFSYVLYLFNPHCVLCKYTCECAHMHTPHTHKWCSWNPWSSSFYNLRVSVPGTPQVQKCRDTPFLYMKYHLFWYNLGIFYTLKSFLS